MKNLIDYINRSQSICIVAHIDPDGDALGASFALSQALRSIGKSTQVVCDNGISYTYDFLPHVEDLITPDKVGPFDFIIAVDCADVGRLGESAALFNSGVPTACIDHHVSNTGFADINLVDVDKASSSEIVYNLINEMNIDIDVDMATLLYAGISTDTGNFSYSNTNKSCFVTAGELLEYGIDLPRISYMLYRRRSLAKTRLIGKAISNIKMYMNGEISYMFISGDDLKATRATEQDFEGVVDYARDIIHVEVAICAKQVSDDCYKINFRSTEKVDVQKIATKYGGGGHKGAAGCIIKENLDETIEEIIGIVKKELLGYKANGS